MCHFAIHRPLYMYTDATYVTWKHICAKLTSSLPHLT